VIEKPQKLKIPEYFLKTSFIFPEILNEEF